MARLTVLVKFWQIPSEDHFYTETVKSQHMPLPLPPPPKTTILTLFPLIWKLKWHCKQKQVTIKILLTVRSFIINFKLLYSVTFERKSLIELFN